MMSPGIATLRSTRSVALAAIFAGLLFSTGARAGRIMSADG